MIKLLKHILNEEGQDLQRLALILLILAFGVTTTMYLAHHVLPGAGIPPFTVRAAP